ncbi:MAG: sortase [Candidatus Parcubacteria bacterium]|nr:sortase [Candidatus Parcubacteria bacterium]
MRKSSLGLKTTFFLFVTFFVVAFLILSGRSFFSLINYQIKDIYHYFIFELSRPVNLSLINPNSLTSWGLYKLNNQKEIATTYLDSAKQENTVTTTKPLTTVSTISGSIITPIENNAWKELIAKYPNKNFVFIPQFATTNPFSIIVPSEKNNAWKELIAKYPNKNFVFIPQFDVQAPLLSPKTKNLSLIYKELRSGVVLFPGTANPGSGYTVILGHSSAYPWDPGDYRSVFSLLNKLNYGDPFFIYYQGQIYAFKVVAKKIFVPLKKDDGITTAQALPPRDKPTVVLQSCWPVGVSSKRMAVQGELITEN